MSISKLRVSIVAFFIFLSSFGFSQVTSVEYVIEYDSLKCKYNVCAIITGGETTLPIHKVSFNSAVGLVVPTGVTVELFEENLYWPKNVGGAYPWSILDPVYAPVSQPQNDFYKITGGSPTYLYEDVVVGDTICLFGLTIGGVPNCGDGIRLYIHGVDPSSTAPGFDSKEFLNGFTMGGSSQLYTINRKTVGPPKPRLDPISGVDCGPPGLNINLIPITDSCKGTFTYNWEGPNVFGETSEDIEIPGADLSDGGIYTVTITDELGCKDTISFQADPKPNAGSDETACGGQTVTLFGNTPDTGTWSQLGGNPSGASVVDLGSGEADVTFENDATGEYFFIYDTGVECKDTMKIDLSAAGAAPNFTSNSPLCEGEDIMLSGEDIVGATYVWRFEGTEITTNYTKDLVISGATSSDAGRYTLEVKTGTCTSIPADIDVVVNSNPTADAGVDQPICNGADFTLTAGGGDTYQWDGLTPGNDKVVTPSSTTIYTVTVTDANLCTDTDDIEITVNALPTADAGSDDAICEGESITLNSSGGTDFAWSDDGTLSDVSIPNPEVTPSVTTTYTVTVTDGNLCTDTDEVEITVNTLPTANAGSDEAVCESMSIFLNGSGGGTYLWSPGADLDDVNVSNPETTPLSTTTYTLQVEDSNGCTDTDEVEITVNTLPTANAGSDAAICTGNSIFLNGSGGGNYVWSPGADLDDVNVSNPEASPTSTTIITLQVEDSNGCTATDEVEITVNPLPTITSTASAFAICIGESTDLSAMGGTTYAWVETTGNTGAGTGSSITVSPTSTTTYTVTGEDSNGCKNTSDVTIIVNPKPSISLSANDDSICIGEEVTITAVGGDTYVWEPNLSSLDILTDTPATTTKYKVTGTDLEGCSNSDSITITVNPLPTVTVTASPTSVCEGGMSTLTATGGTMYDWGANGSLPSIMVSPATTETFEVTVTDINNCVNTGSVEVAVNALPNITASASLYAICVGQSTELTAAGGNSYSWVENTGNTNVGSMATITVSPTVTTTYTVTGEDSNGCENISDVTIIVNPLPTVSISASDQTICIGEEVTITATGGDMYSWNPDIGSVASVTDFPATTTAYNVTVTDVNGCTNVASINITVNPLPTVAVSATPPILCVGESTDITATGGNTYDWGLDGSGQTITVSPSATTTYDVNVTDVNGCENTGTISVTVHDQPNIGASATNFNICIGESTDLTASGGNSYEWFDGATSLGTGDTYTVTPTTTTTYTVEGIDSNGCKNTSDVTITVNPLPSINLSANDETICIGEEVTLTASGGDTYTWNPDLSSSGVLSDFPSSSTTYEVIGEDANGCTNTTSLLINVNPLPVVTVTADPTEICNGESTTLTATGGNTYDWGTDGSTQVISVSPIVTTDYEVTVTDSEGCVNTGTVSVSVHDQPNISASATNFNICIGESTDLTASGGNSYEWFDGATSLGSNAPLTVSPTVTTTYTVEGIDSNGCKNTSNVTITVNPLPSINLSANDETICIGEEVTLTATGGDTYTWNPDLSSSGVLSDFPSSSTTYEVIGEDANGCTNTTSLLINVNPLPVVTVTADPTEICNGESTTLTATGGNTYDWGTDGSTQVISVSPIVTTDYEVTVTDSEGCVNTGTVSVSVHDQPNISASATNLNICIGESTDLTASGGNSYEWFDGATSLGSNATLTVSPAVTTTYTVEGIDSNGCKNTSDVTITVNSLPSINLSANDETICIGEEVTLTASGGDTYIWTPNMSNTGVLSDFPSISTTYEVMGEDANGCVNTAFLSITVNSLPVATATNDGPYCEGETVNLDASGGMIYSWTNSTNTFTSDMASATKASAVSGDSGIYTVSVTDANGCIATAQTTVAINTNPIATLGGDVSVCIGADLSIAGPVPSSGTATYEWTLLGSPVGSAVDLPLTKVQSADGGTYILSVSENGCTSTDEIVVTVNDLPIVEAGSDASFCAGENVQLSGTGTGTYTWTPALGLSDPTIANPIANPAATTVYTFSVENGNGCSASDSVKVSVNPLPTLEIGSTECTTDLSAYTINYTSTGTVTVSPEGTVNGNVIEGITAGVDVTLIATIANTSCSVSLPITAPNCDCPQVANPVFINDASICKGEAVPALTVTVASGDLVDWYDAPTGGTLLEQGSASFTSPEVDPGIYNYYAQARSAADNCTSASRTKVAFTIKDVAQITNTNLTDNICSGEMSSGFILTGSNPGATYNWTATVSTVSGASTSGSGNIPALILTNSASNPGKVTYNVTPSLNGCLGDKLSFEVTVNPLPVIIIDSKDCSADLSTYTISFTSVGDVSSDFGAPTGNQFIGIPTDQDVKITVTDPVSNCERIIDVAAAVCSCPTIAVPVNGGDQEICVGETVPMLTATAGAGEVIDWFTTATGGTSIFTGNGYQPLDNSAGIFTYYAEARNATDDCKSDTRTPITLTINALPSIVIDSKDCSADFSTYTITFSTSANVTPSVGSIVGNTLTLDAGVDVVLTIEDPSTNCTTTMNVTAPNCSCPTISSPIKVADISICEGETIPPLEATVGSGEVINWYETINSTTILATANSYIPVTTGPGVYTRYAETFDGIACTSDSRTPVTLTINALPKISIDSKDCSADKLTYSITFTSASEVISDFGTTSGNQIVGIPESQDVVLTVRDVATNCTITVPVQAVVCSCPAVAAPIKVSDLEICEGEVIPTLEVTAEAGLTVNWYATLISTTPLATGTTYLSAPILPGIYTYYAESQNTDNCVSDSRTPVTLTINALPTITINSQTCASDLQTYTIDFSTNGNVVSVSEGTLNGNLIEDIASGLGVVITVTDPITNCTTVSTVNPKTCDCPTVAAPIKVTDISICENDQIPSLEVTVPTGFTVDWYDKPAGPILLADDSTSFTPIAVNSPGVYTYYAEARNIVDGCISDVRTPISLTINAKPDAGPDQTVKCFGSDVANLEANGANGVWTMGVSAGNATIESPTNANSIISGFSAAGDYSFIWTINNCADTVSVKVGTDCSCTIANNNINPPAVTEYCGVSPETTLVGTDATPAGGSYQWLSIINGSASNAPGISTNKDYKTSALPVGNYTFRRVYTSNTVPICMDTTSMVTIVVVPQPNAGTNQIIECVSSIDTVTVITNAQEIGQWSQAAANPQQIIIDDIDDPSTEFTGFTTFGTYTFTWSNGLCSDSFVVTISENADAGTSPPAIECIVNAEATLSANNTTGLWTESVSNPGESFIKNPTNANTIVSGFTTEGVYEYIWTSNGCTDEVSVEIQDNCPCEIDLNNIVPPFETTYCLTSGIIDLIGSNATPTGGSYSWEYSINNGPFVPMPNVNNQVGYSIVDFGPGNYTIRRIYTIEGLAPCSDISNEIQIVIISDEVTPGPIEISDADPVCIGDTITLNIEPVEGVTYNWSVTQGGVTIVSEMDSTFTLVAASSGVVSVGVTQTTDICEDITTSVASTIDFTVNPNPSPNLGIDTTFCEFDVIYELDAGVFEEYLWDDGSEDRIREVAEKGLYAVTVVDENGCIGSDEVNLKEFCCEFAQPNIINISYNSSNDKFKMTDIYGCAIRSELYIFDRWGNLVFKSENGLVDCWDGTFNGEPVAQGVYVFIFKYTGLDENENEFEDNVSGDITVIR